MGGTTLLLREAEREPAIVRATVQAVRFWFHTFALNRAEGIYTPGAARDHRYRVAMLPADFAGMRVLDVGTFDGFAFLAERRGAERVLAVDNEQYRLWVASRSGIGLAGWEGFRAIHRLLDSEVEDRRMDAFALPRNGSARPRRDGASAGGVFATVPRHKSDQARIVARSEHEGLRQADQWSRPRLTNGVAWTLGARDDRHGLANASE